MRLSGLARKRVYLSFAIVVLVSMGLISPSKIVSAAQSVSTNLSSSGSIGTPVTWTITASAGSGGSIDPVGAVVVDDGADQTFTITADPGYEIADVLVDGGSVGAVSEYTFTAVHADHTIEASFSLYPGGTIWAAHLYVPTASSASSYLSNTVLQRAQEMGITHLHLWQYNFDTRSRTISRSQIVDVVQRMKNYGLEPIIDLEYDVDEAVALVTALGSDCMMYEVGKEPHISASAGYATVSQYVSYFNEIVSACRQVNPNAMYGGPTVGSPTTSPESRSGVYVNAYLQQCDGDFLSVHSYFGGPSTKSQAIARAESYTISDVQQLQEKMEQYDNVMPIVFSELQYTGSPQSGTNPDTNWSWDEDFMDEWTTTCMSTMEDQDVYAIVFWVLIGYDNNFAILRPPSQNYYRKPQFYSIQSYLIP